MMGWRDGEMVDDGMMGWWDGGSHCARVVQGQLSTDNQHPHTGIPSSCTQTRETTPELSSRNQNQIKTSSLKPQSQGIN